MFRHHPPWRYWGPCPITPRLYVVPLPYSACVYYLIIIIDDYHYLQWRVENSGVPGLQSITPLKDDTLQACWGDDQNVGVALAAGFSFVWIITEADNGYTYVTNTSRPHFPSSFPLVVSWMAKELLSGVLPRARQTRR